MMFETGMLFGTGMLPVVFHGPPPKAVTTSSGSRLMRPQPYIGLLCSFKELGGLL